MKNYTTNRDIFLFDTYAILEIVSGSKAYERYLDSGIIINEFIFAELCYKLLREKVTNADEYIGKYSKFILRAEPMVIKEAMVFRIVNIKKKFSMTDCVSYIMSKKLNIKFLTGDKEFEEFDNVEFVK